MSTALNTPQNGAAPGRVPPDIKAREEELIKVRRKKAGVSLDGKPVGVALSGGGIRSATFCLGLFQGLARKGLLRQVDYLSTVSGGGYFGGFLGRMFTRPWVKGPTTDEGKNFAGSNFPPCEHRNEVARAFLARLPVAKRDAEGNVVERDPVGCVEAALNDNESPPLTWLRESSNYLIPRGAPDMALAAGVSLRNWISMLVVMLMGALTAFLCVNAIRAGLWQIEWPTGFENWLGAGAGHHLWWTPALCLPVFFCACLVSLGMAYWLSQTYEVVWYSCLLTFVASLVAGFKPEYGLSPRLILIITAVVGPVVGIGLTILQIRFGSPYRPQQTLKMLGFSCVLALVSYLAAKYEPNCNFSAAKILTLVTGAVLLIALVFQFLGLLPDKKTGLSKGQVWIRNCMAIWLRVFLLLAAGSFLFALLDGWGQTIYAVISFTGGWRQAWPAVSGVLGLTLLVPLMRSFAMGARGSSVKIKMPLQLIALAVSLVVVLVLLVGMAFISHGLAWRWGLAGANAVSLTQLDADTHAAETPGGKIYFHYCVNTNLVELNTLLAAGHFNVNLCCNTNAQGTNAASFIHFASAALDLHSLPMAVNKPDFWGLLIAFVVSLTLCWFFGRTVGFLNLSSLHTLYTARLVRAYQGASGLTRWEADADITETDTKDDLDFNKYRPFDHGGPLHLINCTINCTESVESATESTTAKGLNLCVGPAGITYGLGFAVDWTAPPKPAAGAPSGETPEVKSALPDLEPLSLGNWVGISGAAVSTGLGNVGSGTGTTLGYSLICGLFNVRLGYWWKNNFSPSKRWSFNNFFPVQDYLADEFTASFHILERDHWYLTDGGHFENTAAYELIRRRVPFIILADCGADPGGALDDLANLVRRVRIDFGAEIKFAGEPCFDLDDEIKKRLEDKDCPIGQINDIRAGAGSLGTGYIKKHATLATVTYVGEVTPATTILVIKPGLTGDEPSDLLNYQRGHPTFPQTTTLDQFYDEAEWESYRKLGEYTMNLILPWLETELKGS